MSASSALCIRVKRGRETVFLRCTSDELISSVKNRLAEAVQQPILEYLRLHKSLDAEAEPIDESLSLDDCGIKDDDVIYFVYRELPNAGNGELQY